MWKILKFITSEIASASLSEQKLIHIPHLEISKKQGKCNYHSSVPSHP